MNSRKQTVSVIRAFPVPLEKVWAAASHPARLSGDVAMLRDFQAPEVLEIGSSLAETHTILGWPQRYTGRITQYERAIRWAMTIQAFREKLHPRGVLGVTYLSLEPKTGELVLRNHLLWWGKEKPEHHRALAGYAYAAHFNRTEKSFFHRIPRHKRSRSGWIGLFSSGIGKPILIPELNSIHFDFQIAKPGDFGFLDSMSLTSAESADENKQPPPRIFNFGELVSSNQAVFKVQPSVAHAEYTLKEFSKMGAGENSALRSGDWLDGKTFRDL